MAKNNLFDKFGDFLDKGRKNIKDRLTLDITDLLRAIDQNDLEMVMRALDAGVDPNDMDGLEQKALPIAVDQNSPEIVRLLLKAGANPDVLDNNGESPLMKAVSWENEVIVKLLLIAGARVDFKNSAGHTARKEGESKGYTKMLYLLDNYQNDMKVKQKESLKEKELAKHEALKAKGVKADAAREEEAKKEAAKKAKQAELAEQKRVQDLEAKYKNFEGKELTALIKAIQTGDKESFTFLIDKVTDMNAVDEAAQTAPLLAAIMYKQSDMIRLLIEKGADTTKVVPQQNHSALSYAVSQNLYKLVQLILEQKGEDSAAALNDSSQVVSPQFLAYNDAKMLDILLTAGADPRFGGQLGVAPIVKAIEKSSLAILPVLVKNKVDLNEITDGKTLLEWAIHYNRIDWVNGLLDEEVDLTTTNDAGQTALAYAESLGDRDTIVGLLKNVE